MNANFKPLGLAAAVATATAGYAGVVNAQATLAGNTQLGDLAIVPYYTVMEGYATGVNVINTSDQTQAVKIRFRRASDSMDALDFDVVLSPYDMYTGYIQESGGDIKFISNDNSCTAPVYPAGGFTMPDIFREGAETGYIEILSMGSPIDEDQPVAVSAKHDATGVPADCVGVRDNFYANPTADLTKRGVIDSTTTHQVVAGVVTPNTWVESPDSLKVSYFIKSDETGVEFGNNAVHIEQFLDGPAMTNQQFGVADGDLLGFDHPNLDGGSPIGNGASIGLYDPLRWTLGAEALINDWSQNSTGTFTVDTDWVVTIPGQYLMMDLTKYIPLEQAGTPELCTPTDCDFRDIPMTASFTVYDREEQGIVVDPGDLVISPQRPGEVEVVSLDKEVNVVQWGVSPVLNAPSAIVPAKPEGAQFGWSSLVATPSAAKTQSICTWDITAPVTNPMICTPTTSPAPIIGFAAWQRAFAANPGSNYGRIVEHSRVQSSS